jgi:tetratricopeptide (TPR) repeat protein
MLENVTAQAPQTPAAAGALPPCALPPRRALTNWLAALIRPRLLLLLAVLLPAAWFGGSLAVAQVRAWHHLRSGRAALEAHHNREATEHLEACVELWPDEPEALLLAARAARRRNDFGRAKDYLDRCGSSPPHAEKAALERVLLKAARGEMDQVGEYCRVLLASGHPDSGLILEALISGCLRAYRMHEANACILDWKKREPNSPAPLFFAGLMHLQLTNQQDAADHFRRVVRMDPDHEEARLFLTNVLVELKLYEEALPHLQLLQRRLPRNLLVQARLASCLEDLGRQAEAEKILAAILERDPNYPPALTQAGRLANRTGDVEKAEKLLTAACKLEPANHAAHYQLYLCLGQQGKIAEAKRIKKHMKQIEKDLEDFRDIVGEKMSKAPFDPALHAKVGEILLRFGAPDDALRWYHSALQHDPNYAPAHEALARYFEHVGQTRRAAEHRSRARSGQKAVGSKQ